MAVDQVLTYADQQDVKTISLLTGDTEALPISVDTIDRLLALSKHAYIRALYFGKNSNSHLIQALSRRKNISILTHPFTDASFENSHFIAAGNAFAMTTQIPFVQPETPLDYDNIGMRLTFNDPTGAAQLHEHVKKTRQIIRGRT